MGKIRVELLEEYTDNIKEYEVVTREEALKSIDNFNLAKTLVDYASSHLCCIIEINLKTGEVYERLKDGSFMLGDTTTIRFVADIDDYYDLESLSQIVEGYNDFNEFEEQYQDWQNGIDRGYDYEFDYDQCDDVYEAYVVKVLKKDIIEFHTSELINIMDENIGCEIYEDTEKFYNQAKVITQK